MSRLTVKFAACPKAPQQPQVSRDALEFPKTQLYRRRCHAARQSSTFLGVWTTCSECKLPTETNPLSDTELNQCLFFTDETLEGASRTIHHVYRLHPQRHDLWAYLAWWHLRKTAKRIHHVLWWHSLIHELENRSLLIDDIPSDTNERNPPMISSETRPKPIIICIEWYTIHFNEIFRGIDHLASTSTTHCLFRVESYVFHPVQYYTAENERQIYIP